MSSSPRATKRTKYRALILRHGQTDANANGFIQGSSDFSQLTTLGKNQAIDALQAFTTTSSFDGSVSDDSSNNNVDNRIMSPGVESTVIASLYCSPLRRARQTLQILRDHHKKGEKQFQQQQKGRLVADDSQVKQELFPSKATTLHNLREIDFYDWEGRNKKELSEIFPIEYNAWKNPNPYKLKVFDSTTITTKDSNKQENVPKVRYPLFELWDRADLVWDEIFEHEQRELLLDDVSEQVETNKKSEQCEDASSSRTTLIVAHGSLGQALLGTAMGWDAEYFGKYRFPNCGIVEIEWDVESTDERSNWKEGERETLNGIVSLMQQGKRPLASRWRWKWPTSSEWKTHSESV